MNLKDKKLCNFYEFKGKFTIEEEEYLKSYALSHIIDDESALLNYAINKLLEEYYPLIMLERLKGDINDNKSNS